MRRDQFLYTDDVFIGDHSSAILEFCHQQQYAPSFSGQFAFEMIQEFHKLPTAVALLAGADDFAIQNVERGEQGGRAMPLVVVRLALRQARSQRQERSGAIQSLNLALFVHTQYQRTVGW